MVERHVATLHINSVYITISFRPKTVFTTTYISALTSLHRKYCSLPLRFICLLLTQKRTDLSRSLKAFLKSRPFHATSHFYLFFLLYLPLITIITTVQIHHPPLSPNVSDQSLSLSSIFFC